MRTSTFWLAMLMLSCSEYDLGEQDGPVEGGPVPEVAVEPGTVSLASCGEQVTASVAVRNAGDAPLEVTSVEIAQGSWTVAGPTLPATLQPAEEMALTVTGTGDGVLRVRTNDPEQSTVDVPLQTVDGASASLVVLSPSDGDVINVGQNLTLASTVTDADGDPTDLEVVWTSSVDGEVARATVGADGSSRTTWLAEFRTPGDHTLTASVDNTCGTASESLGFCQQGGYVEDDLEIETWNFEGSASWDSANGWLQITPTLSNQVGSAFETSRTVRGDDVVVRFSMFIGGGTGADGMSLSVLDMDRFTTYLGGDGCGLGFGYDSRCNYGPALPGYQIEFDTYYNSEVDPTSEDHVAFYVDGQLSNVLAWAAVPGLEDSGWREVEVRVQAPAIEVSIDGQVILSQFLTNQVNFDFPAQVGFTAGTGYYHNLHLVDTLEVEQLVCGG